jgi:hypothetical protein
MEEISWTDRVKNAELLYRVKEERNIPHTTKRRKAIWTGHASRRNRLLELIIEGKIELTGRRGRRRKQLLDDLKETRSYCELQDEALDCTVWRIRF